MIVCQCNVMGSSDIRQAVDSLLKGDPLAVITPGRVFQSCRMRPQCGGCMASVTAHIVDYCAARERD